MMVQLLLLWVPAKGRKYRVISQCDEVRWVFWTGSLRYDSLLSVLRFGVVLSFINSSINL
ncbi:AAEL007957-PA [Aedes aegypti]|uniref:AAEL007957-PA n=1 Tax=Aedes aegypti TaxID=7159 RepID=Q170C0_AEDAE|nr:AAEL007957-PA [Aedes aegypti]